MALYDDIRILSGARLFQGFALDQLRLLAFGAERTQLQEGKKLYREDDDADAAYIVVRGRIGLYREHGGERVAVGSVGEGAMLGELALIADTRRMTSAFAETDSELIRLGRPMFRRILEEYPQTAELLHDRIVQDLQALVDRIVQAASRFAS